MHDYKDRPGIYDRKIEGKPYRRKRNDYVLWFLTALAVTAVINAVIEVMNTW